MAIDTVSGAADKALQAPQHVPTVEDFNAGRDWAFAFVRAAIAANGRCAEACVDAKREVYATGVMRPFLAQLAERPELIDGFDAYLTEIVGLLEEGTPVVDHPWLTHGMVYGPDFNCFNSHDGAGSNVVRLACGVVAGDSEPAQASGIAAGASSIPSNESFARLHTDDLGVVLLSLSTHLEDIRRLSLAAGDADSVAERDSLLAAIFTEAGAAGAVADRTKMAITGSPGLNEPDAWLSSPVLADALSKLEGRAVEARAD